MRESHLVIINCSSLDAGSSHHEVIKDRLLVNQCLSIDDDNTTNSKSASKCDEGDTTRMKWSVSNKYYEAEVEVAMVDFKGCNYSQLRDFMKSCKTLQSAEVCIVYWPSGSRFYIDDDDDDEEKEGEINGLQQWRKMDTKLWVLDAFESEQQEETLQLWCLKQGIELIDLSYNDDKVEDDDDNSPAFFSENGERRVVSALHAHQWGCMRLRSDQRPRTGDREQRDGPELEGQREEEANEGGDFEELFGQLMDMKSTADGLRGDERKRYAEDVVTAFWKAMGGDPTELLGDGDGDDD